jgi:fucokinase
MQKMTKTWDYLIVTAANDQQAEAYDIQIQQRRESGELQQIRHCLVVPDIDGQRIGSGGSTLHCIYQVLCRERRGIGPASFEQAEAILGGLRILIIHAGGDSRRLPAYSHCGKMFVPLPAKGFASVATSLFDRLVPEFLALPKADSGQAVVASGDALVLFDPSGVRFRRPGITALASFASPNEAAHHGVFCAHKDGSVRRFLQKPSPETQVATAAVNEAGFSVLDLGVMSCDAGAVVQLMRAFFEPRSQGDGEPVLVWKTGAHAALLSHGVDLYREICCALGTDTTLDHYLRSVRGAGSTVDRPLLAEWFHCLRQIPFNLDIVPRCRFFHFGTTRQLITSGIALLAEDSGGPAPTTLVLNSDINFEIKADHAWIESCFVADMLTLDGFNTVVGVNVVAPLRLHKGACLDISLGISRKGERVWFLRYYDINDTFKDSAEDEGTFCGRPLQSWRNAIGAVASDLWPAEIPEGERTLWNARVFPAVDEHKSFPDWLWLFDVETATEEQKIRFLEADRYSSAEIALRVDQAKFHGRRSGTRTAAAFPGSRKEALPGRLSC